MTHHHSGHHHALHAHGAAAAGPGMGHFHGQEGSRGRLLTALIILGSFTLIEAIGGYVANSIALLAEAAHMLADSAALVLAVIAVGAARRPADARRTYGHRRYQPLAAFINGQLLLLLTVWVVYEAIRRLLQPPVVNGRMMLAIAVLGGVANLAALLALGGGRSLNERSARAHVLSDLLGSAAATAAALLILFKGWSVADPLLSLLISALILRFAWAITRQSADVLLEGVPAGFDVTHIEAELHGHVPGLVGVHHVHVWTMTGERPNVEHTTVQIEEDGPCQTPECGPPR